MDGLGIAILPHHVCIEAMEAGKLLRVLPAWRGAQGIVHLAVTTRRGCHLTSALINYLAANSPRDVSGGRTSDEG
jgi:DNA-binding transcriptional LysR family regulator